MPKPRVLVVEDDTDIADVLRRSLRMEGYEVRTAGDGVTALDEAVVFEPDAVILDLGLPRLDGVEVAKRLRSEGDVPILILTARDRLDERVTGLDAGADDYLVKPFEREELLARIRAMLRRRPPRGSAFLTARDRLDERVTGLDAGADDYLVKPFEREELLARIRAMLRRRPPRGSAFLTVADLRLNSDTREVFRGERAVDLTAREFELLEYLMRNERLVVSREALLEEVWGYAPFSETNTVDVFVSNLRRKLEAGGEPRLLHTIRGSGYVLRQAPPQA